MLSKYRFFVKRMNMQEIEVSNIFELEINFRYGISYHGAAQSASGTKEQVTSYREKSKKLFQSIGQFSRSNRDAVTSAPVSDIANINDIGAKPKTPCKSFGDCVKMLKTDFPNGFSSSNRVRDSHRRHLA